MIDGFGNRVMKEMFAPDKKENSVKMLTALGDVAKELGCS